MNAKMPELKRAFERAGFDDVRTVASSGNVVFSARKASETSLQRRAEEAMKAHLGKAFLTIVRSVDALQALLAADPFDGHRVSPAAKRIVTFLREAPDEVPVLPIERHGARILHLDGREVFSAYLPGPKGPVFMTLIERTFGVKVTTRTWDMVKKVAR